MKTFLKVLLLFLVAFGLGYYLASPHAPVEVREIQANVNKKAAEVTRGQAETSDKLVTEAQGQVARAEARARTAKATVQSLQASLDAALALPPAPETDKTIIREQAALIGGLNIQVGELENTSLEKDKLIASLTFSRDKWKETSEFERARAIQLEYALEAQKALTKSALWKGRWQGFIAGFGSSKAK